MKPIPPARLGGFSLMELLFVLVILGLLAALLFPVFGSAREKARQAACVGNMRQLGMAFRLYMQDNDEIFPINRTCVGGFMPPETPCAEGMTVLGWLDMVAVYTRGSLFKCPSDPTPIVSSQPLGYRLSSDPSRRTNINRCSYAKNNNLGNVPPPFGYIVHDAMTYNTATTVMLMEWAPNQGGGANDREQVGATFNIYRDLAEQSADGSELNANANVLIDDRDDPYQRAYVRRRIPSKQHQGGANYIFTDGHARWLRSQAIIGQFGFSTSQAGAEYGNNGQKPDFRLEN
jgi:prepilin-type N-terminal cleavage/methylation domain-containing protein/prepilin-type processing-associated H-X9-DG protein